MHEVLERVIGLLRADPQSRRVEVEQAEGQLRKLGFRRFRARHHGELCRIQLAPDDFHRVLEPAMRDQILDAIRGVGYRYVALDLSGYRSAGMAGG